MSIVRKRALTLLMLVSMCLSLLSLAPIQAGAVNEIRNATTTLEYGDPVVMMEVSQNAVRASGTGYTLSSASWIDSSGKAETGTYKKGSYKLVIVLQAKDGYVFASDAKGYINNSNSGITTERSGDGATLTLTKSYNATIWAPIPIKHPGSETVKEGGWCSFVVSGMYVGSYEWVLESPDGKTVPAAKLGDYFPKLRQEGDGTSKIKLYDIPYEMNGWKIYCTEWSVDKLSFTNTNSASLTVTTDRVLETPAPTPESTPEPTPEPAETPAPEEAAPAADPAEEPGAEEEPPAEGEHVHQFSETWSYDEQTHWHACEGCDVIEDQALHDMTWTVTTAATGKEPGEEEGVCSVCGYRSVREIPVDEEAAARSEQNMFRYILFGLMAILLISIVILVVQAIRRASRRR